MAKFCGLVKPWVLRRGTCRRLLVPLMTPLLGRSAVCPAKSEAAYRHAIVRQIDGPDGLVAHVAGQDGRGPAARRLKTRWSRC